MAGEKFYITTSIAYANASPHIGFALESVEADLLARWHRQKGDEVFFLSGVDEHGTKIVQAAKKNNKSPQEFVDDIAAQFRRLKDILNLSWDEFIRTSDRAKHWPGVIAVWNALNKKGDIYLKEFEGLYCVGCESFKTPKDLVNGQCPEHLTEPELVKEKNYFFRLSRYGGEIEKRIKNNEIKIIPESRKNETLAFLRRGLEDISISRPKEKNSWGIPVPGDDSHTIYVWFDALPNYLSALGFGVSPGEKYFDEKFKKFWPADAHFIGKDILRFHAIIWPAILLAAGLEVPKNIFVHGYITSGGQKMSKSLGNVVSPEELAEKYGADALRYYFLREIPSSEDGDYTEEKFKERYNGDLANGLGNFAARVLTLDSRESNLRISANISDKEIENIIKKTKEIVEQKINEFKFHEALSVVWGLISFGDNYINQTKPWENRENRENAEEKKDVLVNLIRILEFVAHLLSPFLPEAASKISQSIQREGDFFRITKGENLFPRR